MEFLILTDNIPAWTATCSALVAVITAIVHIGGSSCFAWSTSRPSSFIRHHFRAWKYLLCGPDMIQEAFDKSQGKVFELHAPDNRYVFVSSPEQIKELDKAPDTVLSLQAASKHMLQPKYSMHGFNWFDRRGTEGVGFIRALRTLLTNYLPRIMPDLRIVLRSKMIDIVESKQGKDGTSILSIYPSIVKLVVLANSLSFFGDELAHNERFMESALSYVEETFIIAEIVRLLPGWLQPVIGKLLGAMVSSQAKVYEALMVVAEERVRERDDGIQKGHNDCIQWIMETSPKQNPWSAQRIVFELMAIWFGSVHAMSTTITFTIHDLCIHSEYVEPLRKESSSESYSLFEQTCNGLPLLDSFIKESARLTPVESLSTRRQALQPFSLVDGTHLRVGDWACTPVRALMQDARHYPQPLDFYGFRFVKSEILSHEDATLRAVTQRDPSKLTDIGDSFHVWGTGRMACPGRFYAAAIMKIVIAQLVLHYDMELIQKDARRWWTWRSLMLPRKGTLIRLTPRLK